MAKKNRKRPSQFQNPLLSNASKTLFANIRFVSIDEKAKTIVVTSTGMDEGKTQVSTNLACAIASSGKKVLIVDTDMRRRCIAGLLGIHTECGLYSVLVGQAPLKSAIYPTDRPNLYFMDSEPNIPSPPDVLSTKRFSALVDTLREMFDYVIFDSPPIGLFVDAAIISNLVDGTLYVIRERAAKRDDVVAGVQQLKAANARILGSVITFSREEANNDYYYAYYNTEGKRVSRKDREKQLMENPNARDLAADDIGQWARKAGIDPNQAERREAGSRPRRQGANAGMGASAGVNPNANAGAGMSPTANQQRAAQANGDEQFPRGAFKPAAPRRADGRVPRHKNTRI
ncbi:CpsD/CapB family tyrosine-protein kinase [uncultured Ellagibacter sp.]|uniref:CpsD/CapB family tyrosine-protein kinase n=1 Tax=uncultured Ellagibacter sp. TaxID=2137580 RepID=UPI00262D6161|nr:CpsD/CapB family tyrosine-protein kinase [uncultured Ellagibacter sp.]